MQKVKEYNQEMPQSLTVARHTAPWGRDTEPRQLQHKGKATSSLFLSKVIVKLEKKSRTITQNKDPEYWLWYVLLQKSF